jgi:vacuolar protein sorting-associated protein 41
LFSFHFHEPNAFSFRYLLSKTGQTKRALYLIIDKLGDVSEAISFAKDQGDPDLWDDLLDYSMDKPRFIRGLLEEVGTSIDPIKLVKRIPEGLEIEGLREGIHRMIREYEIQFSISDGVAKVLRGEVASGMETLRAGQKKGVKFEVVHETEQEVEIFIEPTKPDVEDEIVPYIEEAVKTKAEEPKPGYCVGCAKVFIEDGEDFHPGFASYFDVHANC